MRRDNPRQALQLRVRIAQQAAKLIAEHGIQDRQLAKRKAAQQLGVSDARGLPGDDEVDMALREYLLLFESEAQPHLQEGLRREALGVMQFLQAFEPVLVGDVAKGIASRHAVIEVELFLDSSKAFEQFLLNHGVAFAIEEHRGWTRYRLEYEGGEVWVKVLPGNRSHGRHSVGEFIESLSIEKLQQLLRNEGHESV